ncbi:MAG: glucose-6-phosphate isomerase [Peptococcaceae bacterium BICA1-8]|nr:MAG: glucose-6-phosphate isomerase [Peptococcaceae bacterium BICA1-8]
MISNWQRFRQYFFQDRDLGIQLDISQVKFPESYLIEMEPKMQHIYTQIGALEGGAIANPDEQRMVGHYWLRAPELAPTSEISEDINATIHRIKIFTKQIHEGTLRGEKELPFKHILVVGIGGSSLGPRFISVALLKETDPCALYFIENTDPDGMDRILTQLEEQLDETLTIVISKSGGTIETRNSMEEVRHFYKKQGLEFKRHAVSITQSGSHLDRIQSEEGWLNAFPMWDWIGGRTSVLSAVGLLPLALQGIDIDSLLKGAKKCDQLTRKIETGQNPAALLTLMWYTLTGGKGGQQMVMLPYKDRLELLTKYLQQLIMESLGKEMDLDGNIVHQGIAVLGNKGSTDQHSYLQQLLDGPDNFFVTFIEVLKDREGTSIKIAEDSSSGDYLQAFLLGTRKALSQKGRSSITLTIQEINAETIGALIALFERTVSMYALLVNINAYHQPAVEMGKKAASEVIWLKNRALDFLVANQGKKYNIEAIAKEIEENASVDREMLYKILQHLVANTDNGIEKIIQEKQGKESIIEEFEGFYLSRLN